MQEYISKHKIIGNYKDLEKLAKFMNKLKFNFATGENWQIDNKDIAFVKFAEYYQKIIEGMCEDPSLCVTKIRFLRNRKNKKKGMLFVDIAELNDKPYHFIYYIIEYCLNINIDVHQFELYKNDKLIITESDLIIEDERFMY